MEENITVKIDPKTICCNFDLQKDVDENLKREIKFFINSNEFSAKIIIRNDIKQLLLKHKHENNIHEHGKLQNK